MKVEMERPPITASARGFCNLPPASKPSAKLNSGGCLRDRLAVPRDGGGDASEERAG